MMPTPGSSERCTAAFRDDHIHGIAGVDFATSTVAEVRRALALLHRRGTTAVTASIPTIPVEQLAPLLDRLEPLCADGSLAGIHLEGPFISPARAGSHPVEAILTPDSSAGQKFLKTLRHRTAPAVTMMTVAPEVPGFVPLVEFLVDHGITVALGHTDASYPVMRDAIATVRQLTGAPVRITHCYNAMRGFHHRDPGPLLAIIQAAARGQVLVELIADGHHVDLELVSWWLATYPHAVRLVSDASAATLPPGVTPLTTTPPRLGTVQLSYPEDAAVQLGTTLASGAADLREIHDGLIAAGLPHDRVCAATKPR